MAKITREMLNEAALLTMNAELDALEAQLAREPEHVFSPGFLKRMQKLFAREARPLYVITNTAWKRAAAWVVITVLALTASMQVEAVQRFVVNIMQEVHKEYTRITYELEGKEKGEVKFRVYQPGYLPDGFEQNERTVKPVFQNATLSYRRGKEQIRLRQRPVDGNGADYLNTEKGKQEAVFIHGTEGIYIAYDETQMILWNNGTESFLITINSNKITKKDAIKIAESLKTE